MNKNLFFLSSFLLLFQSVQAADSGLETYYTAKISTKTEIAAVYAAIFRVLETRDFMSTKIDSEEMKGRCFFVQVSGFCLENLCFKEDGASCGNLFLLSNPAPDQAAIARKKEKMKEQLLPLFDSHGLGNMTRYDSSFEKWLLSFCEFDVRHWPQGMALDKTGQVTVGGKPLSKRQFEQMRAQLGFIEKKS